MFKLEISINEDTLDRLEKIAAALSGGAAPAEKSTEKKTRAPRKSKDVEEKDEEADDDDFEAEEEKPKNSTKKITLDMIRELLTEKKEDGKAPGIRKALDSFDAEGITKLETKDYLAFYKKLQAL